MKLLRSATTTVVSPSRFVDDATAGREHAEKLDGSVRIVRELTSWCKAVCVEAAALTGAHLIRMTFPE